MRRTGHPKQPVGVKLIKGIMGTCYLFELNYLTVSYRVEDVRDFTRDTHAGVQALIVTPASLILLESSRRKIREKNREIREGKSQDVGEEKNGSSHTGPRIASVSGGARPAPKGLESSSSVFRFSLDLSSNPVRIFSNDDIVLDSGINNYFNTSSAFLIILQERIND
ncbi:hypothetical protein EVAR_36725_1, partial [Eumeta japonica]